MQSFDLNTHLHTQFGIQIRQWLIKQKDARLSHNRPSHGDSLTLAATELSGLAL